MEMCGAEHGRGLQANPEARYSEARQEVRRKPSKLADPMPPRKTSREFVSCPYRKPTQVGGERIPRRMSDLSLRNSAHWLRNFGIRSASGR